MIVFLDIDGVIATAKSYEEYPDRNDLLDRRCIQALNYLTNTLEAAIVISSTWRVEGLGVLKDKLKYAGVKAEVIGLTPRIEENQGKIILSKGRGREILKWIEQNEYKGDYVVIDDEISDIKNVIPESKIIHTGRMAFSGKALMIKHVDDFLNNRRKNAGT